MSKTEFSVIDDELLGLKKKLIGEPRYAGFWTRVVAAIVDGFILLPVMGLMLYNVLSLKSVALVLLVQLLTVIYKPFMESQYGATLGKMALGIKVVDDNFAPITLKHALLRDLPWLLPQINTTIGVMLVYLSTGFNDLNSFATFNGVYDEPVTSTIGVGLWILQIIAVVMVAFDARKQGLHDCLASTFVVFKGSYRLSEDTNITTGEGLP